MKSNRVRIATSVSGITLSAIKGMAMRSAKVEGAASLTWGVPSFQTPDHIREAVRRDLNLDMDIGKYTLPDGLPSLREMVAEHHQTSTGVATDADRNVVITAGNMEGMNALFHSLLDPGDEIIVTDPGFASHFQQIRLCGGKPVFWALDESRGWALDVDALPGLISDRTRAIVLVSPSNPTGRIFSQTELRQIGEIARAHNLLLLIDDPYSKFTYENQADFFNLASVAELSDHIAYLFTFSKAYAMSGWRAGYMIVPEYLKKEVMKVHDATMICAPRISQVAAMAALSEEPVHLPVFAETLARRRSLICQRLDAVPHVFDYVKPQGAYYVFPRIRVDHIDSDSFAIDLLEKAKVTVTPGAAFGPTGENHVRMAWCVEDEVIERAFDRIEKYFGSE